MRRTIRSLLALATTALAAAGGTSTAAAQDALPTAEAQAYLGAWALAVDAQGQTLNLDVDIQDAAGSVAAQVSSAMGGTTKVSRISKSGEKLVLSYSMNAQGQDFPVVITLAPAGDGLDATLDFAGGMFVTSGKGTRK